MRSFHVIVRARPASDLTRIPARVEGVDVHALRVPSRSLSAPMSVSFEQAAAELESLPRLLFEPDGSFVWVAPQAAASPWQLDGVLYDRAGRLMHVDLKGSCPREELQTFLRILGAPGALLFEIVPQALMLDSGEFTRLLYTGEE